MISVTPRCVHGISASLSHTGVFMASLSHQVFMALRPPLPSSCLTLCARVFQEPPCAAEVKAAIEVWARVRGRIRLRVRAWWSLNRPRCGIYCTILRHGINYLFLLKATEMWDILHNPQP